jgi:hypothetical protein
MKKFFQYLLLIILISVSGVMLTNRENTRFFLNQVRRTYIEKPCTKPIKYSIGIVDHGIDISVTDFQKTILQAEDIWEKPIGRNLFQYDPQSEFKINLIYDERQARTEESQKLENNLETLDNSHEAIISQYENLNSTYKKRMDAYNKAAADYEKRKKGFARYLRCPGKRKKSNQQSCR